MTDSAEDIEADLREEVAADPDGPLGGFLEALREAGDEGLRLVVRFDGDGREVLYAREDLASRYTDAEFDDRVETLAFKGLGDPQREDALEDFGALDATVRWFEDAVVATFPLREWSGVVAVLDRRESPIVDAAAHLE